MAADNPTASLWTLPTAPVPCPVHAVTLTAAEAEAVEKAIGCLERALERLREARAGASIYGVHVMWCAKTSAQCALDALAGVP